MFKGLLKNLGCLMLSIALLIPAYVMSYAPYVRCCEAIGVKKRPESFYEPVHYLIDETSIANHYFKWADVCGVKSEIEFDSFARTIVWLPPEKLRATVGVRISHFRALRADVENVEAAAEMEEAALAEEVDESLKILLDP